MSVDILELIAAAVAAAVAGAGATLAAKGKARPSDRPPRVPVYHTTDGVPLVPSRDDPQRLVALARSEDVEENRRAIRSLSREVHELGAEVRSGFLGVNARLERACDCANYQPRKTGEFIAVAEDDET